MFLILKVYFLKNIIVYENIGMFVKYGIRVLYFGKGGDFFGFVYLK